MWLCDMVCSDGMLTRAGCFALFHHYHHHLCTIILMTRGKRLSDDLQAVIIRKYTEDKCTAIEIARSLKCPYTTICGILTTWKLTGAVSAPNLKNRGRPRVLEYEDNQVCCYHFHLILSYLSFLVPFRPFVKPEWPICIGDEGEPRKDKRARCFG